MIKPAHRALSLFLAVVFLPIGVIFISEGEWRGYFFAPVGAWMLGIAIFPKVFAMAPETEMKWKWRMLIVNSAVLVGVIIYSLKRYIIT
ncbi:MAG: hypothetical protein CMJ96_10695 [Planctomycetes bacterium]|nr:hypothetical protein [Planctomycetota bacterium]